MEMNIRLANWAYSRVWGCFWVKIGVSKIFGFSKFDQNRRCFFANKKIFFDDGAEFCL